MKNLAHGSVRSELVARLRTVRPDSVRRWGTMSVHQMVCHVGDAFRMALGQKDVVCAPATVPRLCLKWVVLYAPLRWPAGIPTSPEIDQTCAGTRPAELADDVAEVERLMDLLPVQAERLHGRLHPVLGPMSQRQWLRWGYLHTDHHLRQFGA
jgi:hypothetical protein